MTKTLNQNQINIYIDEAGRWPLAWPLHVGAVLPVKRFQKNIFKDSKKLTIKNRELLFSKIINLEKKESLLFWIGIISSQEIDKLKITKSISLWIQRAIQQITQKYFWQILLNQKNQVICSCDKLDLITIQNLSSQKTLTEEEFRILISKSQTMLWKTFALHIDWNTDFWINQEFQLQTQTIIKWDDKIPEISMASILAKVSRDQYLIKTLDKEFPWYWFAKHKWYGTKDHIAKIRELGKCDAHRNLFLQKIFSQD